MRNEPLLKVQVTQWMVCVDEVRFFPNSASLLGCSLLVNHAPEKSWTRMTGILTDLFLLQSE